MHFRLVKKKEHACKCWKDELDNKITMHRNVKFRHTQTVDFNKSFMTVDFPQQLRAPFTMMFVGKALGDNTYIDGVNQTFELCHGFNNELKICMNLGKFKLCGKTDGKKMNVYTVIVSHDNRFIVRVNSKIEIDKKIKNYHIELDSIIIGASRRQEFTLKGCIINLHITRFAIPKSFLKLLECSLSSTYHNRIS